MSQQKINEAEWRDDRNWHGGWLGLYRSSRDTRGWVPKRNPAYGYTVNFAHPEGAVAFMIILTISTVITVIAVLASNGWRFRH